MYIQCLVYLSISGRSIITRKKQSNNNSTKTEAGATHVESGLKLMSIPRAEIRSCSPKSLMDSSLPLVPRMSF